MIKFIIMNLLTIETYHNEFLCQEKNIHLLLIFHP